MQTSQPIESRIDFIMESLGSMRGNSVFSKTWPQERVLELVKMLLSGSQTNECVSHLGASRNSIISKVHLLRRYGFDVPLNGNSRNTPKSDCKKSTQGPKKIAPLKSGFSDCIPAKCDEITALSPGENPKMIRLVDLRLRHCRYPIGDPKDDDFGFCGNDVARPGFSYCQYHMRIAYQPKQKVERRMLKKAYR